MLRTYLVDDERLVADLFEGTGPLSTFAARIELAHVLGLIGAKARRDLSLIRKVRNMFAHEAGQISFDDEASASRCGELYSDIWQERIAPRRKFIRVTMGTLGVIHGKKVNVRHRRPAKDIDLETGEVKESATKIKKILEGKFRDALTDQETSAQADETA